MFHSALPDLFEVAPPQIKFSKYAVSLDRIFKAYSLESFRYNLRNPKTFRVKETFEDVKSREKEKEKIEK